MRPQIAPDVFLPSLASFKFHETLDSGIVPWSPSLFRASAVSWHTLPAQA